MKCEKNQNNQGDQKLKTTVWLSLRLFYVLGVFEGGGNRVCSTGVLNGSTAQLNPSWLTENLVAEFYWRIKL